MTLGRKWRNSPCFLILCEVIVALCGNHVVSFYHDISRQHGALLFNKLHALMSVAKMLPMAGFVAGLSESW